MDSNDAYENEHQARRGRALLDQLSGELAPGMSIGPARLAAAAGATGQVAVIEGVVHA
jgi:hypothetical protein